MQQKQGVALAFNTVIIAIITLLVLVVLVFMLLRSSGSSTQSLACPQEGGRCIAAESCTTGKISPEAGESALCKGTDVCCRIVPQV